MALITTRVHAAGDYAGAALMLTTSTLPLVRDRRAVALLRVAGATTLVAAALTDNELGLWRRLPMRTHLALDGVAGVLMSASAALLRGAGAGLGSWVPAATIGLGQIAGAALTERSPSPAASDRLPSTPGHLGDEGLATDPVAPTDDSLALGSVGPADEQLVAQQEAAAAAEAASIGGVVTSQTGDPALDPVYEAGGGESEGFEAAEADLIENATHGEGHGDPGRDAIAPEVEADASTAVYGEADRAASSETEKDSD